VHFAMDDDVAALVDSIADFFERRGDSRAIAEDSAGSAVADRQRWQALCEMGVPVLRLPEPEGIGAGLLEASATAERFGAVLLPEPAVAALTLAPAWSSHPAAAQLLEGLCSGSRICTLSAFDSVAMSPAGEINGRARIVDDGISDAAVVLAHDEYTGGSALVILDRAALPQPASRITLDPTRPVGVFELAGTEPADVLRLTQDEAARIRQEYAVLTAAELVGGMQQVLTDTVEFVTARTQFGRPIGSFQAIKHQLADVYALTEQARALVQHAALTIVEDAGAAAGVVGSASRWVPRSAINVFETAIHLHGAMGYSWEVNVHLHLRRALVLRTVLNGFGDRNANRRSQIAEAV
jgi:alkylation response protein AidB-like acyl-CoA dehydrogenase